MEATRNSGGANEPAKRTVTVHVGQFDGKGWVFALSADLARKGVEESGLFCQPSEDGQGLGNAWSDDDKSPGWRIVEEEAEVFVVPVEVGGDSSAGGAVLDWTCPACGTSWSDEWSAEDQLPVLLLCDCAGQHNTWCLGVGLDSIGSGSDH